ncbi:MAG: Ig-like domain-containing protein [Rubripirellula sp.]
MRNLRQFFRRSGLLSSDKRRRRSEKQRRSEVSQRRLTSETLEKRQLLAGDILTADVPAHNAWNRYDVDDNGAITAGDALRIINRLNQTGEAEAVEADAPVMYLDVNDDQQVSAADALGVINAMSRGEEVGELVELLLTARDLSDNPITPDANGDINVDVNTPFDLEVSYDDLRLFNDRLGAFQLFTDISVSQGGVLEPILNETQRIVVDGAITQSPFPTSLTFSIPEAPTGITGDLSYESSFNDFAGASQDEVVNALLAFGYARTQFEISSLDFGNSDIGFEIHWLGDEFGNVDLPNISIEVNENGGAEVPTQTTEFSVTDPASVRFNINAFSRTFNDNEEFYASQNRGSFDSNSGFIGVGGLGQVPLEGGGIPQLTDDGSFPEPFDAFSIRVQLTQPVTGLVVGVNPGEDTEATLLYGRDDAVPQDMVLIETTADSNGNGLANLTINSTAVGGFAAADGTLAATEDMAATLDLASLITGGTPDTVVVSTQGTLGTGAITGTVLTYTPNADANGTDTIQYTATSGTDSASGTITVTIAAVADAPVANDDGGQATNQDTALTIQAATLLANDTDADGDTLTITDVGPTSNTNSSVSISGTTITYTPAAGFSGADSFVYTISDGNGGSDTATVSITVNQGQVDAPIAGDSSLSLAEDSNAVTLSLLTLNTGGAADTFVVTTNGTLGSATITGSTLSYTPNADANGNDSIVYTATNAGGSDTGTISLTITAVNDDPVAGADNFSTQEGVALVITTAQLLSNDTDVDGDNLTVSAVGNPTNAGSTTSLSGSNVTYTPAAGITSDSFQYTVSDGNGGTDTATVSITVTPDGTVTAVANNGSLTTNQDVAATLDLSTLISGTAPITLMVTTNGNQGSASISGTTLTYTPNQGATGSDSIVYTATNSGGSDTGTISVTINAVNVITAGDGSLSTTEDNSASIDLASLVSGATNPTITISTNGSIGNAVLSGTTLTYTPNANANGSDTIVYTASSGGDSDSGTISVSVSAVNDAPNAQNDTATAFTGSTTRIQVLGNDNAGPADEDQSLTIISASSNGGTTTPNSDGTISFTPAAGFTGNTTISYTIQDSGGLQDSATVNVTVQNFNPSTISGALFIDHVENRDRAPGEAPFRNGVKDADESGLAGVEIRLESTAGSTGPPVGVTVLTDANGDYRFENVAPGTYDIVFDVPDSVEFVDGSGQIVTGRVSQTVVIGPNGGADLSGNNFAPIGTTGAMSTVNFLASDFLRTNPSISNVSNLGSEGGVVSLDANGNQEFFIAGAGFEDVVFGELVLNAERDAALLTVVEEDGDVLTARLNSDQFVVTSDGLGVKFFGGKDDFQFANAEGDLLRQEFANFRNAIDQLLSGN